MSVMESHRYGVEPRCSWGTKELNIITELTESVTGLGFLNSLLGTKMEIIENIQTFQFDWWPIILVVAMLFWGRFSCGPKIRIVTVPFFRQFTKGPVINIMLYWGRHHIFAIGKTDVVHGELFYSIEAKTKDDFFYCFVLYLGLN